MKMDEKTKIFNEDFDESSDNSGAENDYSGEVSAADEQNGSKQSMPGFISLGIGVAAGIGAGVFGSHFAFGNVFQKEEVPAEPSPIPENSFLSEILVKAETPIATGINDDMSLEEAYAFARNQIGPGGVFVWNGSVYGTYSEEEWNALTPEQQNDYYSNFNLNVEGTLEASMFDNISLSSSVNDDMTFGEAFAAARSELGTGGVFLWHGNAYNTFYKEEWVELTSSQREEFVGASMETISDFIPFADPVSVAGISDVSSNQGHYDQTGNNDDYHGENYPVANQVNVDGGQGSGHDSDLTDSSRPYDDGFIFDPKPLEETGGAGDDFDIGNISLDDFVHQQMHGEQNFEQPSDENNTDIFPDEFVAGIGSPDDLGF